MAHFQYSVRYDAITALKELREQVIVADHEKLRQLLSNGSYRRVGVAPGVFDIIHPGHLEYLCWARSNCDALVVAVATDESVLRVKGTEPVYSQELRLFIVASLKFVDYATLYERSKVEDILLAISPHVLFEGSDRERFVTDATREVLDRQGMDLLIHQRSEGISASAIKEYIRRQR